MCLTDNVFKILEMEHLYSKQKWTIWQVKNSGHWCGPITNFIKMLSMTLIWGWLLDRILEYDKLQIGDSNRI